MSVDFFIDMGAWLFFALALFTAGFHMAMVLGAPWGHLTMGGKFPGTFPSHLRMTALFNAAAIITFGLVVLDYREIYLIPDFRFPFWVIWVAVVSSAVSFIANLASPSDAEKSMWAPVAGIMTACSLAVAVAPFELPAPPA